jgi:hypothetical protein
MGNRFIDLGCLTATIALLAQCAVSTSLAQTPMVWTWSANQPDRSFIADNEALMRLLQTLEQRQDVDFRDVKLRDAIRYLSDIYAVPIRIDEPALEEETVSGDESITISLPAIKLKHALSLILAPLYLTYSLRDESLFVTNRRSSSAIAVLYDVDVVTVGHNASATNRRLTPFKLAHLIESSIATDDWANAGGTSTIHPFLDAEGGRRLLVVASVEVQESIQSLLQGIARSQTSPYSRFKELRSHRPVRTSRLQPRASP